MTLLDTLTRKLTFAFLKRKVDRLRKDGSQVLQLLDGWKNRLVVIVYVIVLLLAGLTGQDYRPLVEGVLRAFGYHGTPADWQMAAFFVSQIIPIWGVIDTFLKAAKQRRAGAAWSEIFTTPGYAKEAIKDGIIPPVPVAPVPVPQQ